MKKIAYGKWIAICYCVVILGASGMFSDFASATVLSDPDYGRETLRPGETSAHVRAVQLTLNIPSCGGYDFAGSGYFGPKTESAIKELQESWIGGSPVPPDGLVGDKTKAKLAACSRGEMSRELPSVSDPFTFSIGHENDSIQTRSRSESIDHVIIVPGCPAEQNWTKWLARELESMGIPAEVADMPNTDDPKYREFKKTFDSRYAVTDRTVLVGHSCGAAFLVQWLGETKRSAAKLVIVAPWRIPREGDPSRKTIYKFPIDTTISSRVADIVMFTSDNEDRYRKASLDILHNALGGEIVVLPGMGHYAYADMGTNQFPEVLETVLRWNIDHTPGILVKYF